MWLFRPFLFRSTVDDERRRRPIWHLDCNILVVLLDSLHRWELRGKKVQQRKDCIDKGEFRCRGMAPVFRVIVQSLFKDHTGLLFHLG